MTTEVYPKAIASGVMPDELLTFLTKLDATQTSEHVWDLLVDLAQGLGIHHVDYVFATDFQDWQKVQFIRTTVSSKWIDFANVDDRVRRLSKALVQQAVMPHMKAKTKRLLIRSKNCWTHACDQPLPKMAATSHSMALNAVLFICTCKAPARDVHHRRLL